MLILVLIHSLAVGAVYLPSCASNVPTQLDENRFLLSGRTYYITPPERLGYCVFNSTSKLYPTYFVEEPMRDVYKVYYYCDDWGGTSCGDGMGCEQSSLYLAFAVGLPIIVIAALTCFIIVWCYWNLNTPI